MRKILLILTLVLTFTTHAAMVLSPDGRIKFCYGVLQGRAFYTVDCDNKHIIKNSGFAFSFRDQPNFADSLQVTNNVSHRFDSHWTPVVGTCADVRNQYNEATMTLNETGGQHRVLKWTIRVYNDGVAWRYAFEPQAGRDSVFITGERTEFAFATNDSAWYIPADEFAYESLYRHNPLSRVNDANTPLTIEMAGGPYLSIHEAALVNYSEMTLRGDPYVPAKLIGALWPGPDKVCARVALPFATPWRCMMIGHQLGDLITSHLIQNLNEPCAIKETDWIKPMKFVGIWWGMHTGKYTWDSGACHGATTARTKQYMDFAASHHMGGVLAEGWNKGWETWAGEVKPVQDFSTAYPDFDLQGVVDYAQKMKVDFISHHETGGNIPEYERQLEPAMDLCQRLGIHYLKTGYAGPILPEGQHHHGQYMVQHCAHVVEVAARHHINLDAHEAIKPTGLDRTWPNLLTQECARGNEWNATYNPTPPYHEAILPFTRLLAGPYDYTPGIFKILYDTAAGKRLNCTLANQLALFVVFYSPMMMASDMIENYEDQPAFKFIEEVPCSWDETQVPAASIGHYVSIARRKGNRWFVGTVGDENCHLVPIAMNFLKPGSRYIATLYGDAPTTNWEHRPTDIEIVRYELRSTDTLWAAISKAGGQAIEISPAGDKDKAPSISKYNKQAARRMATYAKLKTYGDRHVEHLAVGKPVALPGLWGKMQPDVLSDGKRGDLNFNSGAWQGYQEMPMVATIDMGETTVIHSVKAGFLYAPGDWIQLPGKVEVMVSTDGKEYTTISSLTNPGAQASDMGIKKVYDQGTPDSMKPIKARYIQVLATNPAPLPDWHPGHGQRSWFFCDEVMVR